MNTQCLIHRIMALGLSVLALSCTGLNPARGAADAANTLPTGIIKQMQGNADSVRKNSATYQWNRVNLETIRIVADEKKLENFVRNSPELAEKTSALRSAVLKLRSAGFAHDADRTKDAADAVARECANLTQ